MIFSTVPLSLLQYGRAKYDFVLSFSLYFQTWNCYYKPDLFTPVNFFMLRKLTTIIICYTNNVVLNGFKAEIMDLVVALAVFAAIFLMLTNLETRSTTTVKQDNCFPLILQDSILSASKCPNSNLSFASFAAIFCTWFKNRQNQNLKRSLFNLKIIWCLIHPTCFHILN